MTQSLIVAADKSVDGIGELTRCMALQSRLIDVGTDIHHLTIEPLATDWHEEIGPDRFRSGCAPVEALCRARELIAQGTKAVLISGEDNLKSGYSREERLRLMNVYADDYPLTQAYTDLAKAFIGHHDIDEQLFKRLSESLFENHKTSYRHALIDKPEAYSLPDEKWYRPLTELFRGVDCANPLVDFSAQVLLVDELTADALAIPQNERVALAGVGLGILPTDGPQSIDQIVQYHHLKAAYRDCLDQAKVDFADAFRQGRALLETYTCYPVVPMAFLLVSGLVDMLENIPEFLQQHLITVTGGMNLARAPWNNPALNGIVTMVERLNRGDEVFGLIHANGGLGYRQGVALLRKV